MECHRDIQITDTTLFSLARYGTQSLNAQISLPNLIYITDAAIDDQASPAVFRGFLGQHIPQQGIALGRATVNHHHAAVTGQTNLLFHH